MKSVKRYKRKYITIKNRTEKRNVANNIKEEQYTQLVKMILKECPELETKENQVFATLILMIQSTNFQCRFINVFCVFLSMLLYSTLLSKVAKLQG